MLGSPTSPVNSMTPGSLLGNNPTSTASAAPPFLPSYLLGNNHHTVSMACVENLADISHPQFLVNKENDNPYDYSGFNGKKENLEK